MFNNFFKKYIYPAIVFCGGVIGVGFLSLPYVAKEIGIWLMLLYFIIITFLVIVINLIFCEISLKTPDFKRFPGFVGHYLGGKAKVFAMISVIFGTVGVLLAYLLVGGQFLFSVFQEIFPGNILIYTFVYFCLASIIIYFDIKVVAKVEFLVISLLIVLLMFIFIQGLPQINISNIVSVDWSKSVNNLFLPYGPLLFALWGVGLIPEVEEMITGKKNKLKKIVSTSIAIISLFYFLFVILILGITGNNTNQTALDGLRGFLPDIIVSVSLFAGVLATFTAFVSQGIIFKKTLIFDLGIKHWQAFIMTCFPAMILFLLGLTDFLPLVSFIGGFLMGINGILILAMYSKIGGKKIIVYPLSLVFLGGMLYEIIYFFK